MTLVTSINLRHIGETREDMIDDIVTAHERMFDDFCRRLYATCYPLNNNIGWLSKCMEELELKVD